MSSSSRYADESTLELSVGLVLDARDLAACHFQRLRRKLQKRSAVSNIAVLVASGAAAVFLKPLLTRPSPGLVGALMVHAGRRWAFDALARTPSHS
jgi:hypothetical protein